MSGPTPLRGEVWIVDFAPTRGREQAGTRPALIVSVDEYNRSPSGLVVVMPITRTAPRVGWHVPLPPGEGGLQHSGAVLCDHLRAVSAERLSRVIGTVSYPIIEEVDRRMRYLFAL